MEKEYHSRSYHRFFEGFTEKEQVDENGKRTITDYIPESITVPAFQKKRDKSIRSLMYFCI